jgi:hypothetical protein
MSRTVATLMGSLLLFLAGCATTDPVTQAEIASADFGASPSNYETLIKEHLYRTLIDPTSMLVEFTSTPYKGYCNAPAVVPPGQHFGYGVPLRVNAKNRLGGYAGWKGYVAYIRNGTVYGVFETFEVLGPGNGPELWVKPIDQLVPRDRKR